MYRQTAFAFLLTLVTCVAACGGGGSSTPTTPTTPATPAPQPNRNPVINSISVNPTFGIAALTTYTFASSASDPDNDTLNYTWDLAGNPRSGASQTIVFINGGDFSGAVTVADGKGGSVSQSVPFVSASTTGTWTGNLPFTVGPRLMTMVLTQSTTSGATTGTWASNGLSGNLDPAAQNGIDANGKVTLRCKVRQGSFSDFTLTFQMQPSGRGLVGSVSGSGFGGQSVTLTK